MIGYHKLIYQLWVDQKLLLLLLLMLQMKLLHLLLLQSHIVLILLLLLIKQLRWSQSIRKGHFVG